MLEQRIFELQSFYKELESSLKADTEQQIQNYIETEIHSILRNTKMDIESEKNAMLEMNIVDVCGQTKMYVVQSLVLGKNHVQIDINALPSGNYFLLIKRGNTKQVQKFQIAR